MKLFNSVLFCLISISIHSQEMSLSDRETIHLKMHQIDEALIAKDTSALSKILQKNLTLGHSNGWIETKTDIPKTLIEEGVIYSSIELIGTPEIHYHSENLITSRRNINVNGIVNNVPFDVKLNVLEIWICEDGNWQLLARQSVNRKG